MNSWPFRPLSVTPLASPTINGPFRKWFAIEVTGWNRLSLSISSSGKFSRTAVFTDFLLICLPAEPQLGQSAQYRASSGVRRLARIDPPIAFGVILLERRSHSG